MCVTEKNKRYSKLFVGNLDFENKCSTVVQLKVSAFCIFMQRYIVYTKWTLHSAGKKKNRKEKLNFSYTLNWNINLKLEFAEQK